MKHLLFFLGVVLLSITLSSCSKAEYDPIKASTKACTIEIECVDVAGGNLLADRSFIDNIKIEGENSNTNIKFTIDGNRLKFDADLPHQNDMRWTKDKREATGVSKVAVKFGKQKVKLKCGLRYTPSMPPAVIGGKMVLENVEYSSRTYKGNGGTVTLQLRFNKDGKLLP